MPGRPFTSESQKGKVKTGGRRPGSPNKKTLARYVAAQVSAAQAKPLTVLIAIMSHHYERWLHSPKDQDPIETMNAAEMALASAIATAPYVHPRLQAVEVTQKGEAPTELTKMEFMRLRRDWYNEQPKMGGADSPICSTVDAGRKLTIKRG